MDASTSAPGAPEVEASSGGDEAPATKKKKDKHGLGSSRGIETMFRTSYQTHNGLTGLADTKANIMISINGIIISIMIASLAPGVRDDPWLMVPMAVLLIGCVTSLVFAVLAATPRVTRRQVTLEQARSGEANILFFGNFVGMPEADFVEGMRYLMKHTDQVYLNMMRDLYSLGAVLERKFRLLRVSYTAFMAGFIVGVVLLMLVLALTGGSAL